jgi:hypothetical protein
MMVVTLFSINQEIKLLSILFINLYFQSDAWLDSLDKDNAFDKIRAG